MADECPKCGKKKGGKRTYMWWGTSLGLTLALLSGCSLNRISETYGPDGNLVARSWNSHQIGTTRQSTMSMEQVDGAYNIATGENVSVDANMVEFIKMLMNAVASVQGMSLASRAKAFAPGTIQQAGAQGFWMTPATPEQRDIYTEREITARDLARIQAELEAAKAEALAAAEAARAEAEASRRRTVPVDETNGDGK